MPGVDGFYLGLLHPLSTPAQACLMTGLGLLAGALGPERAKWICLAFLLTSLGGVMAGAAGAELDAVLFCLAFLCSALAALIPGALVLLCVALAATGGALIGIVSVPDPGPAADRMFTMSGSVVGANLALLYLFGAVHFVQTRFSLPWVRVALRVVAAWVGAISVLMLALTVSGPTAVA